MLRNEIVHHSRNKLPNTIEFLVKFQLHRIPIEISDKQEVAKPLRLFKPVAENLREETHRNSARKLLAQYRNVWDLYSWASIRKRKKKTDEGTTRKKRKKRKRKWSRIRLGRKTKLVYLLSRNTEERRSWTSIFAIRQRPLRKTHQPVLPFCSRRRFLRKLIARAVHEARNDVPLFRSVETGRRMRGSTDNGIDRMRSH